MERADATRVDVGALRRALGAAIHGEVRFDRVSRALYSTDASVYQIQPLGVVVAKTKDDLRHVVRLCHEFRCPLTLRGGGTSQAGQAIGPGLIVDTSKYLNRLLEVNVEEGWARVEPGIVLDELNDRLKSHGVRFAPDISTASRATVGGMMANNSAGARSVYYGITLHHVIAQEVILSDGSIVHFRDLTPAELERACGLPTLEGACYRTVRSLAATHADEIARRYPRLLRRVGGYNLNEFTNAEVPFNLAKLMVGSEGTLGVVAEARVRLVPLPRAKAVMAIEFADLLDALEATPHILPHGPSAVEVMDRFILDHTRQNAELERKRRAVIDGDPGALLCVELYADAAGDLPPRLAALERDLRARGYGYRYLHAVDALTQARIWSLREAGLGLSMAMKDDNKSLSFVEDTAVAPERLRDFIERFLAIVRGHGTVAGVYAHASVGCLHVRPVVNLKTEAGVRRFEAIASDVSDLVLSFGGALSGEHGDGLVRSPFMRKMFGPTLYEAFTTVKRTFDPHGILNPGKIVDAPPLTANLRYGPAYQASAPVTHFDFTPWGSLAGAVEMCSGLGACRKTLDGTMCPSYMATRDEAHATRGRANVLRLALAGRLDEAGLTSTGVKEVLDLCLECRACKAECPVGVDMARFKSEFLASHMHAHGTPLRALALGHIRTFARLAAWAPAAANWTLARRGVRKLNARLIGIDAERPLPHFARRTLRALWGPNTPPDSPSPVVLFNDTFTDAYHPDIGLAARDVLQAMGSHVALADNVCCGRPLISQGLLDAAKRRALENTRRLHPAVADGRPLIVLEPSCLSALKEDAPDLLHGDDRRRARAVADASLLFEEFVDRELASGRVTLPLAPRHGRIVLHGHCHQRSLGLVAPAKTLLERMSGSPVVDLDAGCCGMAGSFGYAREHAEVSRRMAERRLLPAARQLGPDDILVAAGVSCRHQVRDLAGVRAWHPAELLRACLADRAPTRSVP